MMQAYDSAIGAWAKLGVIELEPGREPPEYRWEKKH